MSKKMTKTACEQRTETVTQDGKKKGGDEKGMVELFRGGIAKALGPEHATRLATVLTGDGVAIPAQAAKVAEIDMTSVPQLVRRANELHGNLMMALKRATPDSRRMRRSSRWWLDGRVVPSFHYRPSGIGGIFMVLQAFGCA